MLPQGSFDDVLGRLRQGDEQAAEEIFRRYCERLIGLARRRLDANLRRKVDPDDVIQSVFRSFFIRQAQGQFQLDGWDSLWALLARITLRKAGRAVDAFRTQRRDTRRESEPPISAEGSVHQWEAIAREPTPDEAAAVAETLEAILSGLDEREREAIVMRLQGYTVEEISSHVGKSERWCYRLLEALRKKLEKLDSPGSDA